MFITMPARALRDGGALERAYLERQKAVPSVVAVLRGRFFGSPSRVRGHQGGCRFEFEITKVLSIS